MYNNNNKNKTMFLKSHYWVAWRCYFAVWNECVVSRILFVGSGWHRFFNSKPTHTHTYTEHIHTTITTWLKKKTKGRTIVQKSFIYTHIHTYTCKGIVVYADIYLQAHAHTQLKINTFRIYCWAREKERERERNKNAASKYFLKTKQNKQKIGQEVE